VERVTGSVLRWLRAQSPVVLAMLGAVGLAGSLFVADVLNVTHVFRGERRFYVSTKAMEPTLEVHRSVWSHEVKSESSVTEGEIVMYEPPASQRYLLGDDNLQVGRVVALDGQTVTFSTDCSAPLLVDGKPLDEPYRGTTCTGLPSPQVDPERDGVVVVPVGMALILVDNRRFNDDSRTFGPIPIAAIEWAKSG
jgi:signal peptidase I